MMTDIICHNFAKLKTVILLSAIVLVGLLTPGSLHPVLAAETRDAFYLNSLLGHGINLAHAFEIPSEGACGVPLKAEFFQIIKEAGFDSIRIPIRWSTHATYDPGYEIDPAFLKRIDWAIEQALGRNLAVVINVQNYDELNKDPIGHLPRMIALWKQIALYFRDRPDSLFFELLNEPHDELTDERWQEALLPLLSAIRDSNPDRAVIVGPAGWNDLDHLDKLRLPEEDRQLIATFHYYRPFMFTTQGASWINGSQAWIGTLWQGTDEERQAIRQDFIKAAAWADRNHRPLYLGEFGTHDVADMKSRESWTRAVAREAEWHGFTWSYWDFCANFGAYDIGTGAWREPLLKALMAK